MKNISNKLKLSFVTAAMLVGSSGLAISCNVKSGVMPSKNNVPALYSNCYLETNGNNFYPYIRQNGNNGAGTVILALSIASESNGLDFNPAPDAGVKFGNYKPIGITGVYTYLVDMGSSYTGDCTEISDDTYKNNNINVGTASVNNGSFVCTMTPSTEEKLYLGGFATEGMAFTGVVASSVPDNAAPTITGVPSDIIITEDSSDNELDLSAIELADGDDDNLTFDISGSAIYGTFAEPADGSSGGVTATKSNDYTIKLEGKAADINTYLDTVGNIKYTPKADASGDNAESLRISVTDGKIGVTDLLNLQKIVNLDITDINDAPVLAVNKELIVGVGQTVDITDAFLKVTDVDDDDINIKYEITSLPTKGNFLDEGSPITVLLNYSQSNLNDGDFQYQAGNNTGEDTFSFNVSDRDGLSDAITLKNNVFKIKIVEPTVSYSNTLQEKIDNDGSVEGTLEMTMLGGTFVNADPNTYISMTNIPQGFGGLTANFTRNSDTNITLNFTGNAQHHVGSNGFTGFDLTFSDSAFVGLDASDVIDSSETNLTISFFDSILNVEPNKWNMVSFGDGHEVDTTKLNRAYITDAKDIKAFRDGKFVTTASDIGKYEGVWIHPNTDKVPYIVNKFSNPSTKSDQLDYYKSLEGNKWHLVGVPYQLNWSDLVKDNITPNECQSSFFKYYDAANDSYNSTANIPANAGMWIRHNCKGEN
jgi:hypothetical protein